MNRLLSAYFAVGALHLLSLAIGSFPLELATKIILVPLLALWLHREHGPRPVVVALCLSAFGDLVLEFDALFILGMIAFAAAHACYIAYFLRGGSRPRPAVVAAYAVVWALLLAVLWPDLGELTIPVAVYSLLVTSTAVTSTAHGGRIALGGALFLLSDALIAVNIDDHDFWGRPELVMTTYIAAQYLLATGIQRTHDRLPAPQPLVMHQAA